MEKRTKYVKTDEDWYPTDNGKIRIFITQLTTGDYRVAARGGDDFGFELDTRFKLLAESIFNTITDYTTQSQLIHMGMRYA
jgi:hypothetical protein